ncbi:DUF2101 family protein [Thermococcus sp.]
MAFEDFLYSLGERVEVIGTSIKRFLSLFLKPEPSNKPPAFRFTARLVKRKVTVHELMSLHLQLTFLAYLFLNFLVVLITRSALLVILLAVPYFLYLRYFIGRYGSFMLDVRPYRFFYHGVSLISFFAFLGYAILRKFLPVVFYYYVYLVAVVFSVLLFWWYFKRTFGRDYAYGIVEEVKGDLVRVFVHDDICANVKPGLYWVPAVSDVKPGRVVKVLVEERFMRGAVPVRILEVYLSEPSQSSQTETSPNDDIE